MQTRVRNRGARNEKSAKLASGAARVFRLPRRTAGQSGAPLAPSRGAVCGYIARWEQGQDVEDAGQLPVGGPQVAGLAAVAVDPQPSQALAGDGDEGAVYRVPGAAGMPGGGRVGGGSVGRVGWGHR